MPVAFGYYARAEELVRKNIIFTKVLLDSDQLLSELDLDGNVMLTWKTTGDAEITESGDLSRFLEQNVLNVKISKIPKKHFQNVPKKAKNISKNCLIRPI